MIVAGEASGDLHGSKIARYLKRKNKDIHCLGMGSEKMRDAGVELLYDSANIAVVGLWEVLKHWSDIQAALRILKQQIVTNPPDLLLLIDYQEFNLKLAKFAKQHQVNVLFYVSPQLWAWRQGRIKNFINTVDMMAVIFPFEVTYYEKAGIPVRYVGHPLANKVKASASKQALQTQFKLNPETPTIALLPGSRRSEIKKILPILLETAQLITAKHSGAQFLLPLANPNFKQYVVELSSQYQCDIRILDGRAYDATYCSDAACVASGTATLEVALLQTPMAIVYQVSALSYAILRRLIKVPYVGLANIIAGDLVAPEFIQDKADPNQIAAEIIRLLEDQDYCQLRKNALQQVSAKIGDSDGIAGISDLALEMLEKDI